MGHPLPGGDGGPLGGTPPALSEVCGPRRRTTKLPGARGCGKEASCLLSGKPGAAERGREGAPNFLRKKAELGEGAPGATPVTCPAVPRPWVRGHAEAERGQIKRGQAKATLLLSEHIRLGFSAFAGRDSHL